MLHIFYRYCQKENGKPRPRFYSKSLCLKSLLEAYKRIPGASLSILVDGSIEGDVLAMVEGSAEIVRATSLGLGGSFLFALQEVARRKLPGLVYLVEDDYLHRHDALEKLIDCHRRGFADYITLFDDPLRYHRSDDIPPDLPTSSELFVSQKHHWRVIESTTFTFAASGLTIKQDVDIFTEHVLLREKHPSYVMDRESWRHLQGLGRYRAVVTKRKLIGAIPSLATHCETTALSPAVDWERIAMEVANGATADSNPTRSP